MNNTGTKQKNFQTYSEGFTQDIIPIKKFIGGMILTSDGYFEKILEVYPVNFYQRPNKKKNEILNAFRSFIKIAPNIVHIKVVTEFTNMTKLKDNLMANYAKESNEHLKRSIKRFINYIDQLAQQTSYTHKFYISIRYEGESDGTVHTDVRKIYDSMNSLVDNISVKFAEAGNLVMKHEDENLFNVDVLYRFFNRNSMYHESSEMRRMRILYDTERYNQHLDDKNKKGIDERSFVAPRGYDNCFTDAIIMDGQYSTYLAIKSDGYPANLIGGWVNHLFFGNGVDVDFYFHKVPKKLAESRLKASNKFASIKLNHLTNRNDNSGKADEQIDKIKNRAYLLNMLKSEDMIYVSTIITIRGNDLEAIRTYRGTIKTDLASKEVFTEECYEDAEEYMLSTMPLCRLDKSIYKRTKQNMTTSSCSVMYPFVTYECFDETGIVLGKNIDNNSIVAINNYNTQRHSNGNILILGGSGSGKTFTEQCMGSRQTFIGIRTFYLLPVKGHEYYKGIKNNGGTYAKMHPGSDVSVNFLEIRPEIALDRDLVEDDISEVEPSLLSKKTGSIKTFLSLLLKKGEQISSIENSYFDEAITRMYNKFGINDNNDSIWVNKKKQILKPMPHFSDLKEYIEQYPQIERYGALLIPFISGSYKNFNQDTNIDLSRKSIAFDVNRDIIDKNMLPAIMYIAIDLIYDMVKSSRIYLDSIYLDEIWTMLVNESCAEQVQGLVKLIRGYGGACIFASQDIIDLFKNEYGPAIVGNTDIKFLMKMKDSEADRVKQYIDITDEDVSKIKNFRRGEGLLISNGDKIRMHVEASEFELEMFSTDPNVIRMFAERNAKKKNVHRAQI